MPPLFSSHFDVYTPLSEYFPDCFVTTFLYHNVFYTITSVMMDISQNQKNISIISCKGDKTIFSSLPSKEESYPLGVPLISLRCRMIIWLNRLFDHNVLFFQLVVKPILEQSIDFAGDMLYKLSEGYFDIGELFPEKKFILIQCKFKSILAAVCSTLICLIFQ